VNEGGKEPARHELHLEQRLLQAAEDLLAHQGRRVMSVSFPNVDPPLFIVVGETPQLAELLAEATRKVRGDDF
jgi:predicted transcriptional regulator